MFHWFHWSHLFVAILLILFVYLGFRLLEKTFDDKNKSNENKKK